MSANTSGAWISDQRKGETFPDIPSPNFPYGTDSKKGARDKLTSSFSNELVSGLQGTWLTCSLSLLGSVSCFVHTVYH